MVYIFDQMESFDDACHEQALSVLSEQLRKRVLDIHHKAGQRQRLAAYLLLGHALKKEFQFSGTPLLDFTPKGKPYLAEHPDIHFNQSHCAYGVACIIGTTPVGIDIEKIGAYKPDLAEYISSPQELDDIRCADNPAESFTCLWTRKESYLKCTGSGLIDELKEIFLQPVPYHFKTMVNREKKYVCTCCTEAELTQEFTFVNSLFLQ